MITTDSGMAVSVTTLTRRFQRKTNRTITTQIVPSRMASTTLAIAASMNRCCRKIPASSDTSSGRLARIASSVASTSAVSRSVSAPGCFWTERMTAAAASTLPSPRFTGGPKRTSATSRTVIGTGSPGRTTVEAMSSRVSARPTIRMTDSRSLPSRNPPPVALFDALDRPIEFVERHVVPRQLFGGGQHLILRQLAPHDGHLRDPRDGEQARADHPVGQCPQLHRVGRPVGLEPDQEDLAHDRRDRREHRIDVVGQRRDRTSWSFSPTTWRAR